MKLTNASRVRQRIEGFGYVEPGESFEVPDDRGRELRKTREFKEVRPSRKKSSATPAKQGDISDE